jgi:hypothetical protein
MFPLSLFPMLSSFLPHVNRHPLTTRNSYVICIAAAITLYFLLAAANRKTEAAGPVDEAEQAKLAFQDLTDMENPYFRYVL